MTFKKNSCALSCAGDGHFSIQFYIITILHQHFFFKSWTCLDCTLNSGRHFIRITIIMYFPTLPKHCCLVLVWWRNQSKETRVLSVPSPGNASMKSELYFHVARVSSSPAARTASTYLATRWCGGRTWPSSSSSFSYSSSTQWGRSELKPLGWRWKVCGFICFYFAVILQLKTLY